MNESCHTHGRVLSRIQISHVQHIHESCHTYEWVMSHLWISHVTLMNESCHTYESVMLHVGGTEVAMQLFCVWVWHDSFTSVKGAYECDMTREWVMSHWVWHDSFTSVQGAYKCDMTRKWVMSHWVWKALCRRQVSTQPYRLTQHWEKSLCSYFASECDMTHSRVCKALRRRQVSMQTSLHRDWPA